MHIDIVKEPVRSGNNRAHETQICRYLDRLERVRNFSLWTSIRDTGVQFRAHTSEEEDAEDEIALREDIIVSTTEELLPFLWTSGYHTGTPQITDYFYRTDLVKRGLLGQASLCPSRTSQIAENVVYHLSRDPSYKKTIADMAQLYNIPDLPAAMGNFILRVSCDPTNHINSIGGQRRVHHDHLPVSHLQIWKKLRIQTMSYHHPHNKLAPYTLNAAHPSSTWPHGCFDSAIFNVDPSKRWPQSGISGQHLTASARTCHSLNFSLGHVIVDICLIFRIMPSAPPYTADTTVGQQITSWFLAYVRCYDVIQQRNPTNATQHGIYPELNTGLFLLKQAKRANGEEAGDIIPLDQLRSFMDIAPHFGEKADPRFTNSSSLTYATEFWLNKYFNKELFYALL